MNKLEKLHTEVKKLEEHYEDCSAKAMEKNNIQAMRNNSKQKEPCDFCKYIYTIEATSYTYTEPIASLSGLSEINYCPKCGRPLNQPSATDNNVGE